MNMERQRVFAYDVIRAFAILLVVCIHSQGMLRDAVVVEDNAMGTLQWCHAFWHIIYVGVPLFVMLSGALLLGKQESLKVFFKKRFTRILIPFLIWSVIMGVLLFYKEHHGLSGCIGWIVNATLTKGVIGIYWYVYLIAGLYLITPLLQHIITYGGKQAATYTVVLIFAFVILNELFPSASLVSRFACDNLLWVGYYVLGYVIVNTQVDLRKGKLGLFLALGMFFLYCCGVAVVLFIGDSVLKTITTIAEAVLLFFILSKLDYKRMGSNKVVGGGILLLSETSYGMYLTHFLFISLLLNISFIKNSSLVIEPLLLAISVTVVDVFFMCILKRIGLKKWVM